METHETIREQIIKELESFAARTGIRESVICRRALGDNLLYDRLCNGKDCLTGKVDTLRKWMRSHKNDRLN